MPTKANSPNDKITIIIPCYNVEKYIKKCLSSIIDQSYPNFEVFLIDDGSTDNTGKIIRQTIKNDQRFKYFYQKNSGQAVARNFGLRKTKTKYVTFIDSDDYVEKDFLKLLYQSIIENNSDISICYFNRIYKNHTKIHPIDALSSATTCTVVWNKLYKTSLFSDNDISFPEGKWYEDVEVTCNLFMLDISTSIVKLPLYDYRDNNSSTLHTYDDRIYQIYEIMENIENFAKKHKVYDQNYNKLEFINISHVLVTTTFRSSFLKDFSPKTIKNILLHVSETYPSWYQNKYIKTLPTFSKIYLFFLKHHCYFLIYMALKVLHNRILT